MDIIPVSELEKKADKIMRQKRMPDSMGRDISFKAKEPFWLQLFHS